MLQLELRSVDTEFRRRKGQTEEKDGVTTVRGDGPPRPTNLYPYQGQIISFISLAAKTS